MESGQRTSTSPPSFPAVKHLVWAVVAGAVLVVNGMRDDRPPQPPGPPAVAAPPVAEAPVAAVPPALAETPDYLAPPPVSETPVYLASRYPALRPASLVRRPTGPPVLVPRLPVRPAPLRPLPARTRPTGPVPAPGRPLPAPGDTATPAAVGPLAPSPPLRLRIPQLEVDSPMMELGLDAAGALETPPDNNPVLSGWYADGTVPGSVGTAVATGHVDTRLGPGVFYALGALREGATVEIVRTDRSVAVFTVYAVEAYSKKDFPDEKVYGPSSRPELRVITCGGEYDRKSGYRDNVVVFAALTSSR
ncbi:class F sortase [Streptomyces sp. NBC_00101]|uniref:class F sortase n=1 Tax=Streptomyces sp. NBC_00101 TaxID=2975651 RepID=UPI00324FD866